MWSILREYKEEIPPKILTVLFKGFWVIRVACHTKPPTLSDPTPDVRGEDCTGVRGEPVLRTKGSLDHFYPYH